VPAQARALANDEFVHELAAHWATAVTANGSDIDTKLHAAYLHTFARPPLADELAACRALLAEHGEAAWPDLLHTLVTTTEFLYLR
jgi:hypothetical protein